LQLNIVALRYFQEKKLLARFLSQPRDFHFNEMLKLLSYFGFEEVKKGKTSWLFGGFSS
jgi:hypothetical protein